MKKRIDHMRPGMVFVDEEEFYLKLCHSDISKINVIGLKNMTRCMFSEIIEAEVIGYIGPDGKLIENG